MRVYTGIDPKLQHVAGDAIEIGMKQVDDTIRRQRTKKIKTGKGKTAKTETQIASGPMPQVALIALDPHTGQVLALAGGRNYGQSQLNHAVAKRPTGSILKPFVYAAAINSGLAGDPSQEFTEATPLDGTEQCFDSDQGPYCPRNFDAKYSVGDVSTRFALAHSINTATIKLAQMVGYDKVVQLARAAGIKSVRGTPAMAIGSYDATPMEMAGAYTVFANNGTRVSPIFVTSVRDAKGDIIQDFNTDNRQVLDPRVAYVVTTMMEGVMNYGTAAAVRGRDGFTAPAAGKTGTSHDGWFAGYTTNLLCIVWIGYDDYSDLKLEGSRTAAPIWSQFMKRAIALPQYKDGVKPFSPPPGVVEVSLDKVTNYLATPVCPNDYPAAFIAGTEPRQTCEMTAGDQRSFFQKLFGVVPKPPAPPAGTNPAQQATQGVAAAVQPGQPGQGAPAADDESKKKKGFFGKIFGAIKGDNTNRSEERRVGKECR